MNKLPIVGMSSNASDKQKVQCINSGMSDYVDKPIGLLELRAMLLKWTSYQASFGSKEFFEASGDQFSSFSQPLPKKMSYDAQLLGRPYK